MTSKNYNTLASKKKKMRLQLQLAHYGEPQRADHDAKLPVNVSGDV